MRVEPDSTGHQQWLFAFLPTFPLILLVLRLWYLGNQDLQTMLLLVRHVSPLGLFSSFTTTVIWTLPALVLTSRALGALLWTSLGHRDSAKRSWLVRQTIRMPTWVVVLACMLAALIWQMRFIPLLLMLASSITGLVVRERYQQRRWRRLACVGLPALVAVGSSVVMWPAALAAARSAGSGQCIALSTTALLLLPPVLAILLTGPVPASLARLVTHWTASGIALLLPFVIGVFFLRAPVLPLVAIEVQEPGTAGQVLLGHIVSVDDRSTAVLNDAGAVQFIENDAIVSQVLCPDAPPSPSTAITVNGWPLEMTALEWIVPPHYRDRPDPRCLGRLR
ncbi:MAG: hypothetical protein HKP61_09280 [Dactylosporangium sp.]|nr:hypothetical protein [Dactylosporangium sp.]NNJ61124.1 hypothetical protein [Dactylosporangium sp.]